VFRVEISPYVIVSPVENGAIVFDSKEGKYSQVNMTGFRVLEGIIAGHSFEGIVEKIAAEFDISWIMVERDVRSCIVDMSRRGWLRKDAE
jgi:hypothetical protein